MTDHRSHAGDPRRSGRAAPQPRDGAARPELQFDRRADGCFYALLGAVAVGVICEQVKGAARPGWNWLCTLPEQSITPKFAADLDKAKDAMRSAVETWCEAARLVARSRRSSQATRAWRTGEG